MRRPQGDPLLLIGSVVHDPYLLSPLLRVTDGGYKVFCIPE